MKSPLDDLPPKLRRQLKDMEFQYGPAKGKLALAMDLMSDAEISAGQLALYCRNSFQPDKPHPDLEQLQLALRVVRQLVKDSFRDEQAGK